MSEAADLGASVHTGFEDAAVEVELDGQLHRLGWPRRQTLVDMMLEAGIDVPHSCREGHCGSCVATLVSGDVKMDTCGILGPDDRAEGLILGCQSRPVTDEIRIVF